MRAVEVAIGVYHLGLDPDTELNALALYSVYECAKSHRKFISVLEPVAKASLIVKALAKPAVVHNEHIHTALDRLTCEVNENVLVNVKVHSLPGVKNDGTIFKPFLRKNVASYE